MSRGYRFRGLVSMFDLYYSGLECKDNALLFKAKFGSALGALKGVMLMSIAGGGLDVKVCKGTFFGEPADCVDIGYAHVVDLRLPPMESSEILFKLVPSPYQLELIERVRGGGRLKLHMVFRGTVIAISNSEVPTLPCHRVGDVMFCTSSLEVDVLDWEKKRKLCEVPVDKWLEVYNCLGGSRVVILEVSSIDERWLSEVAKYIDEARKLMLIDSVSAFNSLRMALENLKNSIPNEYRKTVEKEGRSSEEIDFEKIYGDKSYAEQIDRIFRSLWGLASRYSHRAIGYAPSRADMEMAIALAMTLVNSIATALKRHQSFSGYGSP